MAAGAYYAPEIGAWIDSSGAVVPGSAGVTPEVAGGFTGELPVGYAGYTAPEVTTLGNVAGTTEGMASGTSLANMGGAQGLTTGGGLGLTAPAADLGTTAGLAGGTGSLVPAEYLAAAAPAAAGSSLSSMLPYMAGGQVATGLLQANAAQKAADVQSAAAQGATQLQGQMFNTINQQQAPYRTAGYQALNKINSLMPGQYVQYDAAGNPVGQGTGTDYLTHQFNAADLAAGLAPNYDFMLQQGQMANQRAANMGGGALGGNALQGLNKYTQDYAGNAYQNAFGNYQTQRQNIYNTLAGIAGIGQTGQNATNTAAQNATNAASQLGVGSAAAQAAGLTGSTNALANTVGNVGNTYLLSSLLNQRGSVA
jgi:hypothetical protein